MPSVTPPRPNLERAIVPDPLTIPHDAPAAAAAALLASAAADGRPLAAERAYCVVVLREGRVVGVVTAAAALALLHAAAPAGAVAAPAPSARRAALAGPHHAARLMAERVAGQLVLLDDDGRVAGLITAATLLPALDGPAGPGQELARLSQELERHVAGLEQSEARLRKSEAHLLAAQRIAQLGSWEFDLATGAIAWSAEVYRIFGRDPALGPPSVDELMGYYHPDDRERHRLVVEQATAAARPYALNLRLLAGEGGVRHIQARGEPVLGRSGAIVRLVGTVLDITDRKRAEVRLREAGAQLRALNSELETFAYSVSHDLRAPLRAIDGFSKALIEDYDDRLDPEGRDYLARIRGAVRRMGLLIDDLLRLSRVSRGEMSPARVCLSALAEQLGAELQAQQPGRQVEWAIAPDLWAWADVSLIRVALGNLLDNAWKFTGGRERARIEFGARSSGGRTVFFVRDDGAGFNPAYAAKLFGVFQRLHDAHEFPGTGVGLATVQRVIARHGGQVWAEGAVEGGATFFFTLPEARG